MREEFRMFKCWRYKLNTHLHYIFEPGQDGKERLVYSSCSLRDDQGKKCNSMEDFNQPCALVLSEDRIREITEERNSSV